MELADLEREKKKVILKQEMKDMEMYFDGLFDEISTNLGCNTKENKI